MNAHRKPSSTAPEATLRERAEALRSATARPSTVDTLEARLDIGRSYAARFDFTPFSIKDLALLYDLAKQADDYWGQLGNLAYCSEVGSGDFAELSNLGRFVEVEEHRMAYLRDRCAAEIAKRIPASNAERDEILCVRIAHQMHCNGMVDSRDAPGLLIEALKAWG